MKSLYFISFAVIIAVAGRTLYQTAACNDLCTRIESVIDDKSCKVLICKIQGLEKTFAELYSKELADKKQLVKLKNNLIDGLLKICSISDLKKLKYASDATLRVLLAHCDAATTIVQESFKFIDKGSVKVADIKNEILESLVKFKKTIDSLIEKKATGPSISASTLDTCHSLVTQEFNSVLEESSLSIGSASVAKEISSLTDGLDETIAKQLADRFNILLKEAMPKHLSEQDGKALIDFIHSPATGKPSCFYKIKSNIKTLFNAALKTVSPESRGKIEGTLLSFWKDARGAAHDLMSKIKHHITALRS